LQAAVQQGITVTRLDGGTFTPYDLKRLQVRSMGSSYTLLALVYMLFLRFACCICAVLPSSVDPSPVRDLLVGCVQAYSNNLVDYHLILDLLPPLTATYFSGQ
jgi:hypothetical protein